MLENVMKNIPKIPGLTPPKIPGSPGNDTNNFGVNPGVGIQNATSQMSSGMNLAVMCQQFPSKNASTISLEGAKPVSGQQPLSALPVAILAACLLVVSLG